MKFIFFLIFPITSIFGNDDYSEIDYCEVPCLTKNGYVEHVMCSLNHDCSRGPECKVKPEVEFNDEMKELILDSHHFYRSRVASGEAKGQDKIFLPEGSNMNKLVWDNELAYIAQCYANKCIFQYNKCRQTAAKETVGQIILMRVSLSPKTVEEILEEMMKSVFEGIEFLTIGNIEDFTEDHRTKDVTQMIWANTRTIGCGISKLLEDVQAYMMICNYSPAGNIEGESIYELGDRCSLCGENNKCDTTYTSLCVANKHEKISKEQIPQFLKVLGHGFDSINKQNETPNTQNDFKLISEVPVKIQETHSLMFQEKLYTEQYKALALINISKELTAEKYELIRKDRLCEFKKMHPEFHGYDHQVMTIPKILFIILEMFVILLRNYIWAKH